MKIYIAGPLFCSFEREFKEKLAKLCEDLGYSTFLPHRDAGLFTDRESILIFDDNVKNLDNSDIVVALLSGPSIDSGTAWEIGYAIAKGKRVIGFVDDLRLQADLSLMFSHSCELVYSLEELQKKL